MYNNCIDLLENCQKLLEEYKDVELDDVKELEEVAEKFRAYLTSNINSFSYNTNVGVRNHNSMYFGPEIKVVFSRQDIEQIKAVISFTKIYSSISRNVIFQVKILTMISDEVTYQKMFDIASPMDLAQAIISCAYVVGVIIP
ncbi:MAG: hypothetical protein D8H99_48170 [Streptococcus sp.]|nr:MAG: hypothetical protein D8H99_48170 [Streptococcus sp.]